MPTPLPSVYAALYHASFPTWASTAFFSCPNPWHGTICSHALTDNWATATHYSFPGYRGCHYARRGVISHEQHRVTLHGGPLSRLFARSAGAFLEALWRTSRLGGLFCSVSHLRLLRAHGPAVLYQRSVVCPRVPDVRAQTPHLDDHADVASGSGLAVLAALRPGSRAVQCLFDAGGPRQFRHICHLLRASAARTPLYGVHSARSAALAAASPPGFWRGAGAADYAGVATHHASDPDVSRDQGAAESGDRRAGESVPARPAGRFCRPLGCPSFPAQLYPQCWGAHRHYPADCRGYLEV